MGRPIQQTGSGYEEIQKVDQKFEKLTEDTSRLNMHVIYRSVEIRDQILKLPFAQGINMAHNRIQDILGKSK